MNNKELSINSDINEINLDNNRVDNATALVKAAVDNVPVVGSILSEVVGLVIPNQKVDRIKLFVEVLAQKVNHIEKDVLEAKMKTVEFTDLFEDALPQAARALTDERREYIATFLKNSLTSDEISHLGEKKLLSLLNELNDAEIIFLKYDAIYSHSKKEEFYQIHQSILEPVPAALNSPQSEFDKLSLWRSYKTKLRDMGLTTPKYKRFRKGEIPEFDEKTGMIKSDYQEVSGLGRMLLRYIDDSFAEMEENDD